jgi:hypothetical protein
LLALLWLITAAQSQLFVEYREKAREQSLARTSPAHTHPLTHPLTHSPTYEQKEPWISSLSKCETKILFPFLTKPAPAASPVSFLHYEQP